jgi:glycosyltransferase involved in cell wall biosynthesis
MSTARVSAILPAFNCSSFLAAAIDSALGQQGMDVEVVVVDDGSNDDTPAVMASYRGRIIALRQANRGPSAARNAGIAATRGEFVAFLDADDTWEPGKTLTQVAYLERHPACGLVFCDVFRMSQAGRRLAPIVGAHAPQIPVGKCLPELFLGNRVLIPGVMVRRSVLDLVGVFDESLRSAEDYDLWLRIAEVAEIGFLPEPLASWREREGQASRQRDAMLRGELLVLEKALRRSPDLRAKLGGKARRRLAQLHDESGWLDLVEGRLAPALGKFLRAARYDPGWEKPYRHVLATAISALGLGRPA